MAKTLEEIDTEIQKLQEKRNQAVLPFENEMDSLYEQRYELQVQKSKECHARLGETTIQPVQNKLEEIHKILQDSGLEFKITSKVFDSGSDKTLMIDWYSSNC